jgi:predicted alpha/beta hydrolase family esterase
MANTKPARVLILHGWTNRRPEGGWHRILASELRKRGHQVLYPQFPSTDNPTLEDWQELLLSELELLEEAGDGESVVVAHSLGCINFIHAAVEGKITKPVDRLLFVAPADPALLGEIKGLNVNLAKESTKTALRAATKSLTIVGSDADQWSPNGIQETFGQPLGVRAIVVEGAQHFSKGDGWGHWQGVINWVLDENADISIR